MQVDLSGVPVFIGMPVYGRIPARTAMSLALTLHACGASDIPFRAAMEEGSIIQAGRDALLDDFLRSDCRKLFWIDSDMVWQPEDFCRLLALSTVRDVVCAAYPTKVEGPVQFQISMSAEPQQPDEFGLLEIHGLGLGFAVVDRAVCQQLADRAVTIFDQLRGRDMASVFRVDTANGMRRSEDMAFFADIRGLGHKVWLDPSISLGHIGDKGWRGDPRNAFHRTETGEPR